MPSTVLVFIFPAILTLLLCPSHGDPVVDVAGNPVLPDTQYNIVSYVRGAGGGGLTMMSRHGEPCPLYVRQEPIDVFYGLPLQFLPANASATTVEAAEDVQIRFNSITVCITSNIWKVAPDGYVSTVGTSEGSNSWFRFKKYDDRVYEIVFCGCPASEMCGKIGIFVEDDVRWLRLGESAFLVQFRKVENEDDSHALLGYA